MLHDNAYIRLQNPYITPTKNPIDIHVTCHSFANSTFLTTLDFSGAICCLNSLLFFWGGVGGNVSITHHYHDEIHSDLHSKDTKSEFVPEKTYMVLIKNAWKRSKKSSPKCVSL